MSISFNAEKVEGGWIVTQDTQSGFRTIVATKDQQVVKYLKEIMGEQDAPTEPVQLNG